MTEHLSDIALLYNAPGVHDGDSVAHAGDNAEIMSDKQQRHLRFHLQFFKQVQVLQLNGDVERGGRFIGNQDLRRTSHGDRPHHALLHPPAHLMRKVILAPCWLGHSDLAQGVFSQGSQGLHCLALMLLKRLHELIANREHWVQRGLWILQNHRDVPTAYQPHVGVAFGEEILAIETDFTAHDASCRAGHQTQQ